MVVSCGHCGQRVRLPDHFRQFKCPTCGEVNHRKGVLTLVAGHLGDQIIGYV